MHRASSRVSRSSSMAAYPLPAPEYEDDTSTNGSSLDDRADDMGEPVAIEAVPQDELLYAGQPIVLIGGFAARSRDHQQRDLRCCGLQRTECSAAFAVGQRKIHQHDIDATTREPFHALGE